jgi:chaperonin GroEL
MNEISKLSFHSEAREKMIAGVKQLSSAVGVTLGPKGKNVAIVKKGHKPHLTKDGVTVANAVNLPDAFENLGCQIVKEAAQRTADLAGDGTTTSTILASSLLVAGHKLLEAGYDARLVVQGFEQACYDTIKELELSRITLTENEQLVSIATVSSNGDCSIGEIIATAIERVGSDGPIAVENAKGFDTHLEFVDGTVIDQGYLSPYFATNQNKGICELEKVYILLYNQTVNNLQSILPALEMAASSNRALLIIANDYTTEALQALVMNKVKGALRVCAIKAPEFGNARTVALQDLSLVCGGLVLGADGSNIEKDHFTENILGYSEKAVVDKSGCVLIGTKGDKERVFERIEVINKNMNEPGIQTLDLGVLARRRRRLSDGIAIIRVGGITEADMLERRDRVDDALCASKAAKSSGIQPGGGVSLVRATKRLLNKKNIIKDNSIQIAYEAFVEACCEPFKQIMINAGLSSEIILQKILRQKDINYGFNVNNCQYGDMIKMKIIDPHDVVVSSLKHATAVAGNILLIGCAISNEIEDIQNLGIIENL